jgi:hypothetical protein
MALAALGLAAAAWPLWRFCAAPRAVSPPAIPPRAELRLAHVDAELTYLLRYLDMAARNPELGVGTAASPNGVLDAYLMLWRSLALVSRLAVLYYGRPGVLGTLRVARDVGMATAGAASLQSAGDSLGSVLARTAGGLTGVLGGPAFQGVTNAVVLVRVGYLARERCRSFRRWDLDARKSALRGAVGATQRVAVGLATEILRQVGYGIGAVAQQAASGAQRLGSAALGGLSQAAGSTADWAAEIGQKLAGFLRGKPEERDADAAGPAAGPAS